MMENRKGKTIARKLATVALGGTFALLGMFGKASFVHAAALTSTNVQPASLTAGATSTVTVSFTTASTLPLNGKIKVTFPGGFTLTGVTPPVSCTGFNGSLTYGVAGQVVTISRSGDGGATGAPAAITCTIPGVKNPTVAGSTGTYTIQTTDNTSAEIDVDAAVAADTTTAAALTSTNVQPAALTTGATGTATVTFTTFNSLENNAKIAITFPNGYSVAGANSATCSPSMDGSFSTGIAGQVVTITRSAGTTSAAGAKTCTIAGITNPTIAGSTGTYTITTTDNGGNVHDTDAAVAADTIVASALTSTNVQPATLRTAITNTVTVSFTTINTIKSNEKILVTFPSGYLLTNVSSTDATCSTMDGSFSASVGSQTVTITRSGGTSETPAAETCTIAHVINPSTVGTTGTYTITTTDSTGAVHDTDAAVTGDFISSSSESSGSSVVAAPLTYAIEVTKPEASEAYAAGDDVEIEWSTAGGTGTPSFVNLSYSVDGGSTWSSIVTATPNDGTYVWTAPAISVQSVLVKAVATDLVTALATGESDAFSIGTNDEGDTSGSDEESDNGGSSVTLLPEGSYMRGTSWTTVYYIGADGMRHPFLDSQTFFTYQDNFDGVTTVSDDYLANYTIGTPMLPKAGTVLVKVQSVNKVYALEADNTLRWITSEDIAKALYGNGWASYVIDVPVTAWGHFNHGEDVNNENEIEVDRGSMETRDALNSK